MKQAGLSRRFVFLLASLLIAGHCSAAAAENAPPANGSAPDPTVEEVLVTGSSVSEAIDQARFSESIVDVLSAEDFATTGDSGVVDALSRVTGVTTVGDKYVYVRGLGERYSSNLFNGASLPSPDPVRRVVPLDLFPSGVMEQLTVQKTYSPALPADFSGGSVQLTTRSVPSERDFHFDVELKTNTQTTGKKTPILDGGGADWTGFDDGFRKLPSDARGLDKSPQTDDERRTIGQGINRSFRVQDETLPPGYEMAGRYANSWKTPAGSVGVVLGAQGKNDWQYRKEKRREADSATTFGRFSTQKETTNSVDYAGLGSVNWTPAESQLIKATLFWSHLTDNRYREVNPRYDSYEEHYYRDVFTDWEEQSLLTAQLSGSHEIRPLGDLLVDWGVTYSQAKRVKPDSRFYGFIYLDPATPPDLPDPSSLRFAGNVNNEREWEDLTDDAWDAIFNASLPIELARSLRTTLKAGAKYFDKQRESERLRFRFLAGRNPAEFNTLPIEEIFSEENIRSDFWQLIQFTNDTDLYTAEEEVIAGYVQSETEIGDHLRLMAGARYESSRQQTQSAGPTPLLSVLEDQKFYPAVELTWLLRDDLQLRGAWSQTTNRPDLRELSEAIFDNPDNHYEYFGNPDLKSAELLNYDLRLEWYHGAGDSVEIAGFYKDISDPIQEVALPAGNFRTWRNSEQAWLAGVEVAAEQNLALLGMWADDFTVRTNAAYIDSEVTESPDAPITNRKHPLQGQSTFVFNFQITHDYLPWDLKNTLAVNVFGERITDLGSKPPEAATGGRLDAYEQPSPTLDYVMKWGFTLFDQDFGLTFKAKNLLNSKREVTRGAVTEREYRDGVDLSLEVGYDF